ncbi:hypothetical protein LPJ55_002694 [Coemansia sp. RSA 990]|nr:hypothetical protein LPJ55_002694 [Coemansia sp. RSA 990]
MVRSRHRDCGPYARRTSHILRLLAVFVVVTAILHPVASANVPETKYPNGEFVRWSHASIIADKTLYVFGGKYGDGNAQKDYASSCMSLDLSSKLSISNAEWLHDCSKKGPLLAGHTATINRDINMIMLFGGTVPGKGSETDSSLHLFSAEIKFWNTPASSDFPLPLVNHSASLDVATGDLIVYGGRFRDNDLQSNSTLRMVTNPTKHADILLPPTDPLSIIKTTPRPSASKTSTSKPKPTSTESSTTRTSSSTKTSASSSTKTSTSSSTKTSTSRASSSTASTSKETPKPTTTSSKSSSTPKPTSSDEDEDERGFSMELLNKRATEDDKPDILMTWSNNTLPDGMSGRVGHTLTAVNGTHMVVLGGASNGKFISMGTLFVYDGRRQAWTRRTAVGKVPQARRNHVATVVNNTQIVVHGGANVNSTALGDVAVLDTDTWTWLQPKVANSPKPRYDHAAVQAGPYMILTFGRAAINDSDYGIYILDTTSWEFVEQYDPGRAKLTILYKNEKVTGGTIFGLFIASAVAMLVLMILAYIACVHYYTRHPHLENGEGDVMLPSTELRNFGRKITVRLRSHRRHSARSDNKESLSTPLPVRSRTSAANSISSIDALPTPNTAAYAADNSHLMVNISRDSSLDLNFMSYGRPETAAPENNFRLSRRTHLDDVELPTGLRNRDSSTDALAGDSSGWSRPTTSNSEVQRKSTHVSDVLPRIVGSRLTLPAESAGAVARYRFDELEDMPPMLPQDPMPQSRVATGLEPSSIASPTLRPSVASDQSSALARPIVPYTQSSSPRDSIDLNLVLSQNQRFYIVNPDN